ncbi:MAG: oligosaccharide flippase family protein [Parvularcula sp.]|nr:oligosaccharide flippase family protein [Parvularcula sp.]
MAIPPRRLRWTLGFVGATDKLGARVGRTLTKFAGDGVGARARRSAIWSVLDFGGSQGLRLLSNLLLTRLLFPEAFGLMALVSVIMIGLALFSDTGIQPLIVQNERGDDPDFLNTAWTVEAIRGVALWLVVLAIAAPISALYNEPQLAELLPIAGLILVIEGVKPTSVHTVNRHLALGRYVCIKLGAQAMGLLVLTVLAWQLLSVWALVIGNLITAILTIIGFHLFLPGQKNRLRMERSALKQIFRFGKWIFLSTAAGFLINQGDRAILGFYVSLEDLGIYSIGYFLASVPVLLNSALQKMVMTPLYRMRPPTDNDDYRAALFRARRLIAAPMLVGAGLLAFAGPMLIALLYDFRYVSAGAMITLFSISVVPMVCLNTTGAALAGAGDTRSMFFLVVTTAIFQTTFIVVGVQFFGVPGALIAPGLSIIASYPLRLMYSIRHRVFDPVQDIGFTLFGLLAPIAACVLHKNEVLALFV